MYAINDMQISRFDIREADDSAEKPGKQERELMEKSALFCGLRKYFVDFDDFYIIYGQD